MELRHTHILVPLQTWSTIKNKLAILEHNSPEVLAMSQKGCDVNEISGVVNNLMTTVNTNNEAFCTCEYEAPEFENAAEVLNSIPNLLPQMQTASIPGVMTKHPLPHESPPPRNLLLKDHGPCANAVWPQKQCPRRSAPYLTGSGGTSSSSTNSTWWTNEYWS